MPCLQEQTTSGERKMPALRERLKRRRVYLIAMLFVLALLLLDSIRSPANQVTAGLYVGTVRGYQAWGRPLLKGHIQCRYCPSCSEYSIQVVEQYGIWKGFGLTVSRLYRCRASVPLGTCDPVEAGNGDRCEGERLCRSANPPVDLDPTEEM